MFYLNNLMNGENVFVNYNISFFLERLKKIKKKQ